MKQPAIHSNVVQAVLLAGLAASVALVTALAPVATALAETKPKPGVAAEQAKGNPERLERLLKREQNVLSYEQRQLDRAASRMERIQNYIEEQKAKGKNTSKLESALAEFKARVAKAQSYFDAAKKILDAKAGFDANGKVTDVAQARKTVLEAGKAERQFERTMRQAIRYLVKELREYRRANGS